MIVFITVSTGLNVLLLSYSTILQSVKSNKGVFYHFRLILGLMCVRLCFVTTLI